MSASAPRTQPGALGLAPRRQAAWIGAQAGVAALLAAAGLWASHPELALSVALAAGVVATHWQRAWALPLVAGVAVVGGGLATAAGLPWIVGAGLGAGALLAWVVPEPSDFLDTLNGALGGAAGAGIGLWAAYQLPAVGEGPWGAAVTATVVAVVASQALLPLAWRQDAPRLPRPRRVRRALQVPYRPPVFRAIELAQRALLHAPDPITRRGLAEVATWVFRLQSTVQALDGELASADPARIQARIAACREDEVADPFTRDRRQATAMHLERLLGHREVIVVERQRTEALVDYALAFLEEARAGLAVAREMPGEAPPDRLPEVLHRLRGHAAAGDARRRTAREMGQLQA